MTNEEPTLAAKDLFHEFRKNEVRPFLRAKGFSNRGQTFCKWVGKNAEVISLAWGKWSTPENYRFTVNLGVFNRKVFVFETQHDPVPKMPNEWECQWRSVNLPPSRWPDEWWEVRRDVDLAVLSTQVRSYLEDRALPMLDRYVTDEGLRDFWLNEGGGGIQLAVLLAQVGPRDELDRVLREYRQSMLEWSRERLADEQIARVQALARAE